MNEKEKDESEDDKGKSALHERKLRELEESLAQQLRFTTARIKEESKTLVEKGYSDLKEKAEDLGILGKEVETENKKVIVLEDGSAIKKIKEDKNIYTMTKKQTKKFIKNEDILAETGYKAGKKLDEISKKTADEINEIIDDIVSW